jgi:hypothetical protein
VACQSEDKLFTDRCRFYTTSYLPYLFKNFKVDCDKLLSSFKKSAIDGLALASSKCAVPQSHYGSLIQSMAHPLPQNTKFMLWSRVDPDFVTKTGSCQGKQFFHIGCTLLGHIFGDHAWCGQPGYVMKSTKKCNCFTSGVEHAMWKEASQRFAEKIHGEIYILLNGSISNSPAFGGPSVLGDIEIPALLKRSKKEVAGFTIFMVHSGSIKKETCSSPSINELKKVIMQNGFPFRCYDDPNFASFDQYGK